MNTTTQIRDGLSLPQAAALLRRSWRATYDRVLNGQIEGWQDDAGRWYVSRASLDRYLAGAGTQAAAK